MYVHIQPGMVGRKSLFIMLDLKNNWRKWLLIGVSAFSAYFLVAAFNDG